MTSRVASRSPPAMSSTGARLSGQRAGDLGGERRLPAGRARRVGAAGTDQSLEASVEIVEPHQEVQHPLVDARSPA